MTGFRYAEEYEPPEPTRVTDVAITRFDDVYEVEPGLMVQHVNQQTFPNWDTLRIVHSRHDHLQWMHDHWADGVVSGAEVLAQIEAEDGSAESDGTPPGRQP